MTTTEATNSLPRPEWIKWYVEKWIAATALFDAEQKGWYFSLLMYAAHQGTPPGFLPNDDKKLKHIAQVKELSADAKFLIEFMHIDGELYQKLQQDREQRWQRVKEKFKPSFEYPECIYHPKLKEVIDERQHRSKMSAKAGKTGQSNRKHKKRLPTKAQLQYNTSSNVEEEDVLPLDMAVDVTVPVPPPNSVNQLQFNISTTEDTHLLKPPLVATPTPPVFDQNAQPARSVLSINKDQVVQDQAVGNKKRSRKEISLVRRKAETVFEEDKFTVTEHMKDVLTKRYPELTEGDFEHLTFKFKNVYHGKWYVSWSRCYYNFVGNQIVLYGYQPGAYQRRAAEGGKQSEQRGREGYEPAAERNSRLEREADEYTRSLFSRGGSDSAEDTEALPLTPADYR